jgi:hypothetical protein
VTTAGARQASPSPSPSRSKLLQFKDAPESLRDRFQRQRSLSWHSFLDVLAASGERVCDARPEHHVLPPLGRARTARTPRPEDKSHEPPIEQRDPSTLPPACRPITPVTNPGLVVTAGKPTGMAPQSDASNPQFLGAGQERATAPLIDISQLVLHYRDALQTSPAPSPPQSPRSARIKTGRIARGLSVRTDAQPLGNLVFASSSMKTPPVEPSRASATNATRVVELPSQGVRSPVCNYLIFNYLFSLSILPQIRAPRANNVARSRPASLPAPLKHPSTPRTPASSFQSRPGKPPRQTFLNANNGPTAVPSGRRVKTEVLVDEEEIHVNTTAAIAQLSSPTSLASSPAISRPISAKILPPIIAFSTESEVVEFDKV